MRILVFLVLVLIANSCGVYSFQGVSLPTYVKSFDVESFDYKASYVVLGEEQILTNDLIDKIRNDTRLSYDSNNPDIVFTGFVKSVNVRSEAPGGDDDFAQQQRLTVIVSVDYYDEQNEENNWSKDFEGFTTFDTSENLLDVQDVLLEEINEIIIDLIFRKAFTENW